MERDHSSRTLVLFWKELPKEEKEIKVADVNDDNK